MSIDKATRNRQNRPSIERYQAKAYRKYTIRLRNDGGRDGVTPDAMEAAAAAAGMSVNAWIIEAIRDKL